ncbi:methyl-accepting chemotaxis protein [Calothrix parasitica NIES-267]|uniref:Methyl-accepting chemotaxis protein n=1 Tax=Calothrix parasitica NIES-267 TaxID=1973488 RepID=A0A1Z4LZG0_9CYAN|nr:methyl-accepting chemotaxis protein [Calothrix parasitica NIES-267]
MNYTFKASPQTRQVKTASSKTHNPWLKKFYNLPISRKQLIALIFCQLVSILGMGIVGTLIITRGLRYQLREQAKSEVAVSDINYNIKINQMGLGFRGQSDNPAIIRAAILNDSNRILSRSLRDSVKQILQNEIEARNIEYATLVGRDSKIIINVNSDRTGEDFGLNGLVNQALQSGQQIKASAIVKASELKQEKPTLAEGADNQDALIRYTVTPVRNPQTQEVIGALVSGDIVNGKDAIVKNTLKAADGGYSAVYLNQTGEFDLATSLQSNPQGNINRATPGTPLPPSGKSLLEAAAKAEGEVITKRINIGGTNYTVAAKAVPNQIINQAEGQKLLYSEQPPAILVRGTPEIEVNGLLTQSLLLQALIVFIALVFIGFWAVILRRGMIHPIENLQETAQKFANGDRTSRAEVFATDEIGDLAVSFNIMAEKIDEQVRHQQAETQVALKLSQITTGIRETLNTQTILDTVVTSTRESLHVNRVVFYRLNQSFGEIVAESVDYSLNAVLGKKVNDPYQVKEYPDEYEFGSIKTVENIQDLRLTESYLEQLKDLDVKAFLLAPVYVNNKLYGLFVAHDCGSSRSWEEIEVNLFKQIAIQTSYALEQAELLQQIQQKRKTAESSSEQERQQKERLQIQLLELLSDIEGAASGDLTVRADVIEGEIGTVADFFNSIVESLREIVTEVKTSASQVNDSLGFNTNAISKLAEEAKTQATEINRTLDAVDSMNESMKVVAQNAHEAAIVANSAANTASQSGEAMDLTVENIVHLRETVGDTAKKVKRLGESTQEISRVVALINQISMQTNLLAINAGIEAARAGEEGQGFAVVAEEVGELAVRSASATKEIEQVVENIQRETSELVESMEVGVSQVVEGTRVVEGAKYSLKEILEVSRQIDSLVKSISEATASQVQTSQEVGNLMKDIADISQRTTISSEQVSNSLQKTVEISQRLQDSVGTFTVNNEQ